MVFDIEEAVKQAKLEQQKQQPSIQQPVQSTGFDITQAVNEVKASQPQVIDGNSTLQGGVSFKEGIDNLKAEVGRGLEGALNAPKEMWNSVKDATTSTIENIKADPSLSKDILGAVFQKATSLPFTVAQSVVNIPEAISNASQGRKFEQKINLPSSGQELGSKIADGAIDLLYKTMNKSQAEMEALKKKREARDLARKQQQERYDKLPLAQLIGEFAVPGGSVASKALKTGLMAGVGEGALWGGLTTPGSIEDRTKATVAGGATGGAIHMGTRGASKLADTTKGGLEELATKAKPVIDKIKPEPKEKPISNAFDAIKGMGQSRKEAVEYGNRYNKIQERRNTPLYDRYNPKYENLGKEPEPSQYGVAKINSEANKAIAEQMNTNVKAEADLVKDYRSYLKDMIRKYGSTKNLKDQALTDTKTHADYGMKTDAMKDYQELIAHRKAMGEMKYAEHIKEGNSTNSKNVLEHARHETPKNNLSHVADDLNHVKQEKGMNTPKQDLTGLKNDSRMSDMDFYSDKLSNTQIGVSDINIYKKTSIRKIMDSELFDKVRDLFEEIRDVAVDVDHKLGAKTNGRYNYTRDKITINPDRFKNKTLSEQVEVLAHEYEHAKQGRKTKICKHDLEHKEGLSKEFIDNLDDKNVSELKSHKLKSMDEKQFKEYVNHVLEHNKSIKANYKLKRFREKYDYIYDKICEDIKSGAKNIYELDTRERRIYNLGKGRIANYRNVKFEKDARKSGELAKWRMEYGNDKGRFVQNYTRSGEVGKKTGGIVREKSRPSRRQLDIRRRGLDDSFYDFDDLGDINDNINNLKNSAKSHKNIKALKKLEAERDKQIENYYDIPKKNPEVKSTGLNVIGRTFSPTTTELDIINPKLKYAVRKYEYNVALKGNKYSAEIKSYVDKVTKMPTEARAQYDLALKNSNKDLIDAYNAKYGLTKDWEKVRGVLDHLHNEAKSAGIDVGYVDDYFPRKMKDYTAYLDNYDGRTRFEKHLKEIDPDNKLTEAQKARELDKMLRNPTRNGNPSYTKGRKVDNITPELNPYYEDSLTALTNYVSSMNNSIEMNRFFGKGDNVETTIGNYVKKLIDEGKIKASDEMKVKELLDARFNPKNMDKWLSEGKNVIYATTLGNFVNAVTQAGDLAFSLYKYGFYDTLSGIKQRFSKKRISRKDLAIEQISNEFANKEKTAKALNGLFKVVGLDFLDGLGKETMINSAHIHFQKLAQNPSKDFLKQLDDMFGSEAKQVLEDLKTGKLSENVKFMLFNEVCNFQPITPSEMPINYLKGGNARILYTLKSFTIKQMDAFRNEAIRKIKNGKVKEGLKNLISLSVLMAGAGATTTSIQDVLQGKEVRWDDIKENELLKLFGMSKYTANKSEREGLFYSVMSSVLPPVNVADDLYLDFKEYAEQGMDLKNARSIKHIPVAGKLYYHHEGRGALKKVDDFKKYRKEDYKKAIETNDKVLEEQTTKKLKSAGYDNKSIKDMYRKSYKSEDEKYSDEYLKALRLDGEDKKLERKVTEKLKRQGVSRDVITNSYNKALKEFEQEQRKYQQLKNMQK